jgi:hypothetical protein
VVRAADDGPTRLAIFAAKLAYEEGERGGAAQELENTIKDLDSAKAAEIVDDAYERMNADGRFDGLGFGAGGFPDGKSARVV